MLLPAKAAEQWQVDFPEHTVKGIPAEIEIEWMGEAPAPDSSRFLLIQQKDSSRVIIYGKGGTIAFTPSQRGQIQLVAATETHQGSTRPLPLWISILPPLLAILMALLFREVYSALFLGLLLGTTAIAWSAGGNILVSIGQGFLLIADHYLIQAALDESHLSIIIFSMLIGGMVQVITRNGGMQGVVNKISRYAQSPVSAQMVTWAMGVSIFFDDYANTLVVGNTMRPLTDRMKISREKLAYIVDSTAAPVASIAFITTWIGAELSYIQDGAANLGIQESAYGIFLHSLQYAYYPIFTLGFLLILIKSQKEFGPMWKKEKHARQSRSLIEDHPSADDQALLGSYSRKASWYNAVIPVAIVVLGAIAGLIYTGLENIQWNREYGLLHNLSAVVGASDSFRALLWSSLGGAAAAVLLSVSQKLLSLRESMEALVDGFKSLLTAIVILVLAWGLALITEHLHTATFLSQLMIEMQLSPALVPAITFVLAALVSFSTGSSWGTMAILYPLILPAAWMIGESSGLEYASNLGIFHNTISAVLAGSVLGDHCSPISDTTILSSLASGCDHVEHVRTQLPYALSVGAVALFAGTLPAAFGLSPWIIFPLGFVMLWLILRIAGRRVA